jgi:methylphosphotriester-DNA--protein-cysteine methyltransferase
MPKKRIDYPEQVVVRLTLDDRRRLEDLARISGMSPSHVVRAMLRSARVTPPAVTFQHEIGDDSLQAD